MTFLCFRRSFFAWTKLHSNITDGVSFSLKQSKASGHVFWFRFRFLSQEWEVVCLQDEILQSIPEQQTPPASISILVSFGVPDLNDDRNARIAGGSGSSKNTNTMITFSFSPSGNQQYKTDMLFNFSHISLGFKIMASRFYVMPVPRFSMGYSKKNRCAEK